MNDENLRQNAITMYTKGETLPAISIALMLSKDVVRDWIADYRSTGTTNYFYRPKSLLPAKF